MKRSIRKVAVLGSGVMGSAIACHYANIGCPVLLLDIAAKELTEEEKTKGLSIENNAVKNRIVQSSFDRSNELCTIRFFTALCSRDRPFAFSSSVNSLAAMSSNKTWQPMFA